MNDDTNDRVFMVAPLGLQAFTAETDGVRSSWLLLVPAPWATTDQIDTMSQAFQEDGWGLALHGEMPTITSWTVRVVHDDVYLRQHGGEPLNTQQYGADPWRELIRSTGGLNLCFDPDGNSDSETAISDMSYSPFVLCARAILENP